MNTSADCMRAAFAAILKDDYAERDRMCDRAAKLMEAERHADALQRVLSVDFYVDSLGRCFPHQAHGHQGGCSPMTSHHFKPIYEHKTTEFHLMILEMREVRHMTFDVIADRLGYRSPFFARIAYKSAVKTAKRIMDEARLQPALGPREKRRRGGGLYRRRRRANIDQVPDLPLDVERARGFGNTAGVQEAHGGTS